jgi:hypothetical protein
MADAVEVKKPRTFRKYTFRVGGAEEGGGSSGDSMPIGCCSQGPPAAAAALLPALNVVLVTSVLLQGVDLDQLLDMSTDELVELFPARQRRR